MMCSIVFVLMMKAYNEPAYRAEYAYCDRQTCEVEASRLRYINDGMVSTYCREGITEHDT